MPLAHVFRPITALLASAAILLTGNGLLGALLPIRADALHFAQLSIGLMGSAHFAGLMAGCILCPRIMGRVGHIRSFAAFSAMATATPLLHAMTAEPWAWWALRAINGLCFAGLFTLIESWLNAVATHENRGRVLGSYTVLNLTVVTLGIQLLGAGIALPTSFELFSIVAILYSLAAVPVALQSQPAPQPPREPKLRLLWLMSVSPASVIGCFGAGLVNGAFWTFAPIFASRSGLDLSQIALFMTLVVIGGAMGQWPVGYLSDKLERRIVLIAVAALAATAGVGLAMAAGGAVGMVYALALAYGAMALSIYSVCVAHANDLVHKKRALEVSSGLLLTFSMGAILGPFLVAFAMRQLGPHALFLYTATAHALIAAVVLVRMFQRPTQRGAPRAVFVPVPGTPGTTPAAFGLDPRASEAALEPHGASGPDTKAP